MTHHPPQPHGGSRVLRCPEEAAAPPACSSAAPGQWPGCTNGSSHWQDRSSRAGDGRALCIYKTLHPQLGSWQPVPALGSSQQAGVLKPGRMPDFPAENQAATPTGKPVTTVLSGCASACVCTAGLLPARGSILLSLSDHQKIHSFKVLETPFTLPGIPI